MAPRRSMRNRKVQDSSSDGAAQAQEGVANHTANSAPSMSATAPVQQDGSAHLQNDAYAPLTTSSDVSSLSANVRKRKAEDARSMQPAQPPSKQAKMSTAKATTQRKRGKGEGEGAPDGDDDDPSEDPSDLQRAPMQKPLFNLRDIIDDLLYKSLPQGIDHYAQQGRQFFIRVGTLCSGTDAPVHVMNLFGMLKDVNNGQVFTTINCFGCEIEPFKQGFLMRNSKPQLLFQDARDFAKEGAKKARLVTGTEAEIPQVDFFIAGTSCVDFSSLNTKKSKTFAGLAAEDKEWQELHEEHGDKLSRCHLRDESWHRAIQSMMEASGSGNTSTTTFASAMNYIFEHKPKIVIFENVESAPWQSVTKYVFPLCGYAAAVMKLDTKKYYLPQTRSRKYLVAFSHDAFTREGALALSTRIKETVANLERWHSSSVTDFLLPVNSLELHRARNEMELASQMRKEKDTEWTFSRARHTAFRRFYSLPDERPWIRWRDNGSSNPPSKMWKPWEIRQTKRVRDLLECVYLFARSGASALGRYDLAAKAQIIDASQNVDRLNVSVCFGRTGCLTPCAIPVLALEARPITGSESLKLQGLPIECFDMSIETQEQLQDLAGNAMSTPVVGATILSALACVADMAVGRRFDWLRTMFLQGDFVIVGESSNSFRNGRANIDHGSREEIRFQPFAHMLPSRGVQEILDLGQQTRRRCFCSHILAYSSVDLYVCEVCKMSLCKSCKGNPEHRLRKSEESFEQLNSLPFSKAEYAIRQYFPAILPLVDDIDPTSSQKLHTALSGSAYDYSGRSVLAGAILKGLCSSTYQLRFIEITEVTRIEYVAEPDFIMRVIVEEDKIIWYLHLNEWCDSAKDLHHVHRTGRPIARAVLGPDEASQFPKVWEFWFPKKINFSLNLRLEADRQLRLAKVGDLRKIPPGARQCIKDLEQSLWSHHPECGFPEEALWVSTGGNEKLFLFKSVDPVGPADEDEFVISNTGREMGRTPVAETRPVLLRIDPKDQVHLKVQSMIDDDSAANGDDLVVRAFVDGWWVNLEHHSIRVRSFTGCTGFLAMRGFPTSSVLDVCRQCTIEENSDAHPPCETYQDLLTVSLPIFAEAKILASVRKTLSDLDLTQQLDFAEFVKLVGPCFFAIEQSIAKSSTRRVLADGVVLTQDCTPCAPRVPEVFFERAKKARGVGSRSMGPVVAVHSEHECDVYNSTRHTSFLRIDHTLVDYDETLPGPAYVDVRLVAKGHSLLQQARAYLAEHPAHYQDSTETRGTFAFEVSVLEDPRLALAKINIKAPDPVDQEHAKQPKGFKSNMSLYQEQINSLHWMLQREKLQPASEFVEQETAEVYVDQLRLRLYAHAKRSIVRRGRVVADDVGFGKTAVCLGLIASQHNVDRKEFLAMRRSNPHLQGMSHLHATLIIVPNQLTHQWDCEAKRFLQKNDRIVVIQDFNALQKLRLHDLETADIIICSSKVMQDTGDKYLKELATYCASNDIDSKTLLTLPRVYRAWYKAVLEVLHQVRGDVLHMLRGTPRARGGDRTLESLRLRLQQIRESRQADGGELRFAPPDDDDKKKPLMLLEFFSFARVIWDEFPYENLPVTEFVANCATTTKWMLSGTPPLSTLGDICKVAYLFNVHLARPLSMVNGRQPPVCEHPPLEPLSELETTITYKSRSSPHALQERHNSALEFVEAFMRKNTRRIELIRAFEYPVVLSTSTTCALSYMELQQELSSRMFNANLVAADPRRRLMSRVDWAENKLGRERSTDALMLRASASFQDVKDRMGLGLLMTATGTIQEAEELYYISKNTIRRMEDRGRELFARAFFLGYRLTSITVANTNSKTKDNQEERQLNYYRTLQDIIMSILGADLSVFYGWDAFESAARMLIWDDDFLQNMHLYMALPPDSLKADMKKAFDNMKFCERPRSVPVPIGQPTAPARQETLKSKLYYLELFKDWITKTPLHSRRRYLIDKVNKVDSAEEELLRIEWRDKVPWEAPYAPYDADSARSERSVVTPISDLQKPTMNAQVEAFDLDRLRSIDERRREDMATVSSEFLNAKRIVEDEIKARPNAGKANTKVFWKDECTRRGLQGKSTDAITTLRTRVIEDQAGTATDDDYLSPESCPIAIEDFPQEGTLRIRGGTMEDIFDRLMHTEDNIPVLLERTVIAHAKTNLQKVVVDLLRGTWACHVSTCTKSKEDHYVSLQCGHALCESPRDDATCGVRHCMHPVKDVCIPFSKILGPPRVITALHFEEGALNQDPVPYLNNKTVHGPKAQAVVNLIQSMKGDDQVVVFVQSPAMKSDVYDALKHSNISHITTQQLDKDEANALEQFKRGQKKVLVQVINSEQAAGSNLHNANHVIFVSPLVSRSQADWDAYMSQALGRCIRFRQSKSVHVYHMLMDETIEVDTLEWRKKKEVIVTRGQAVGRFHPSSAREFLARFDGDVNAAAIEMDSKEDRAISLIPRGDIQVLMGDDYISLASARSRTLEEGAEEEKQ